MFVLLLKAVSLVTNAISLMVSGSFESPFLSLMKILVTLEQFQADLVPESNNSQLPQAFEPPLFSPAHLEQFQADFGGRVERGLFLHLLASATAKISVDGSHAGAIIGKGGMNLKQICRETGVKLEISRTSNLRVHLKKSIKRVLWSENYWLDSTPRKIIYSSSGIHASPAPQAASKRFRHLKLFEILAKGSGTLHTGG